jgi:hypothetical protein
MVSSSGFLLVDDGANPVINPSSSLFEDLSVDSAALDTLSMAWDIHRDARTDSFPVRASSIFSICILDTRSFIASSSRP